MRNLFAAVVAALAVFAAGAVTAPPAHAAVATRQIFCKRGTHKVCHRNGVCTCKRNHHHG